MKEIKAFVRKGEFADIYSELKSQGFPGITVTDCEGTGNYYDPDEAYLPDSRIPYMHSKIFKIEIVSADQDVNETIDIIKKHGRTGKPGDGIVYIIDVERAVRIRNGEEGEGIL